MRLSYPTFVLLGLVILLVPVLVRADDDAKSAQQALADFAKAATDGDVAQLNKLVYAHTENEKKLLAAAVEYSAASKQLKDAIKSKLGDGAVSELQQALCITPVDQFLQSADEILKDADVQVAGDQATIKPKGSPQSDGVPMIKDGGTWKIDEAKATADWQATDWEPRINQIKEATGLVKKLAGEVTDGKIATADALKAALPTR